jgi:hypothetical protein
VTETRCEWDLITSDRLGHDLWVVVYAGADRAYFDYAVTHRDSDPGARRRRRRRFEPCLRDQQGHGAPDRRQPSGEQRAPAGRGDRDRQAIGLFEGCHGADNCLTGTTPEGVCQQRLAHETGRLGVQPGRSGSRIGAPAAVAWAHGARATGGNRPAWPSSATVRVWTRAHRAIPPG